MGTVTYRDGIAILQLIAFPVVLVTALLIWKRTGWKAGRKSWRFVTTLSLIRIAGGICTLLTINNATNKHIYIAEAVCELIGIAPLMLTYVGIIGQIDTDNIIPPRLTRLVTLAGFIGLILGIVGVIIGDSTLPYRANGEVKAAMSIFLVVFVIMMLMTVWLGLKLRVTVSSWQKRLFLGSVLSWPFLLIRLIYSAIGDYTGDARFAILTGDNTIYLLLDVLPEIVAMALCVAFGISAIVDKNRQRVLEYGSRGGLEVEQGPNGISKLGSRSV